MLNNGRKLLRIDIGCGSNKKHGCIGIDWQKGEDVDIVLDMTKDKLPFEDKSVEYIYTSHFLEYIKVPNNVFSEISRVAADGARPEIWTPYAHLDDAFCYGHEIFFTEVHWQHICIKYPESYIPIIKARWLLREIVYIIDKDVFDDIQKNRFNIDFVIKYFKGVVREVGALIDIRHDMNVKTVIPKRYYSFSRFNGRRMIR